jgi:hypothetical protein
MSVLEPALLSCLRTLKLSGMLETLDARLAQARAGELGHRLGPAPGTKWRSCCRKVRQSEP